MTTGTRAGWSTIDITPPLGLPMGGRGVRYTPGAAILDPLMASAVYLDDGRGGSTLWVSLDLIALSRDLAIPLRHDLSSTTGVPHEAVIINYAHVHSGPMTNYDKYATDGAKPADLAAYERLLHERIVRVALAAQDAAAPARVSLYRGRSRLGINRRAPGADGDMTMAPNPNGIINDELVVFDIQRVGDEGRAIVFNYACHPVIVYGFLWDGISAGYPGICRRRLHETLGKNVHCQFVQGTAGNVRPRVLADLEAGAFRKATPVDLAAAGETLCRDVLTALSGVAEVLDLRLCAAEGVFMARRDPGRLLPLDHWRSLANSDDELTRNVGRYWSNRLQGGPPLDRAVPWPIGLLRLSETCLIAWMAGEVVAEWRDLVRDALGGGVVAVWGYSQEVPTYLPTDSLLAEGGYEVIQANWYNTNGPAPFATGLDVAAQRRFAALGRQLAID